jgi:putative colanic acid biosynthesis UDP-glucose lipid carrier transferase
MSVVGPRAHAVPFQNKYKEFIPYLDVRQKVKPGVTGWAQVNGYRGDFPDEEKNKEWIRKRVEHDIWYIENWSFGLDIKIILMTIFKMIKGDPNAY